MAVDFASGSLNISTGAIGTTQTVSGLSFFPEVILFQVIGRTDAVDAIGQADLMHSIGMSMKTGSIIKRSMVSDFDEHAEATSDTYGGSRFDAIIGQISDAGAWVGLLDIDDHTSDGFRVIIDAVFSSSLRMHWWAFGGTDIAALNLVEVVEPAVAGEVNVTYPEGGFAPDLLICIASRKAAPPDLSAGGRLSFGFAARTPAEIQIEQGVGMYGAEDGANPSDVGKYSRTGQVAALMDSGIDLINRRVAVSGWNSDGFKLNFLEVDGDANTRYYFMCVKGGAWSVKNLMTLSNDTTTNIDVTGVHFTPKGAVHFSVGEAQSADDTHNNNFGKFNLGFFAGTASQRVMGMRSGSGVSPTVVTTALQHDIVGMILSSTTVIVELRVTAILADGLRHIMDVSEPTTHFFQILMGGNGAGEPDNFGHPRSRRSYGLEPRNNLRIGV